MLWLTKKIFIQDDFWHSEWNRKLGIASLVFLTATVTLSLHIFIILPRLIFTITNISGFIPIFLIGIFNIKINSLNTHYLIKKYPKNCSLYHAISCNFGYLCGFLFGWLQLLQHTLLIFLLNHCLSCYTNFLFRGKVYNNLRIDINIKTFPNFLNSYFDIYQFLSLLIIVLILFCSQRVIKSISIVIVLVTIFTTTCCTIVAGLYINLPLKWIDFSSIQQIPEILQKSCILLFSFNGITNLQYITEETTRPCKSFKYSIKISYFLLIIYLTLLSFIFISSDLKFKDISTNSNDFNILIYPLIFNVHNIGAGTYLMSVGGVCSLIAGIIVSFIPITRLIHTMANDNLLKIPLANKIFGKGGSPRIAVIVSSCIQLPLLFINHKYIETIFQLTVFFGTLKNIISSITYYYTLFNDIKHFTGTETFQSHELTYRKFGEGSDSENNYKSDEETSTDEELDYVFKGQYKGKSFRYGTINKSHNCIFQECQTAGKHSLGHIYEIPIQTEVRLTNSQNDGKIFNCISKKHLTSETANWWLISYLFCTMLSTTIITHNNNQTLKKQPIPFSILLFTLLAFCLFGIIYILISIFFSDINDNLNNKDNNKIEIKRKEILQRLINIFLLQLGIAYFDLYNFVILFIWLAIGLFYYLLITKRK